MKKENYELILRTIENFLDLQLKTIRQMIKEFDSTATKISRPTTRRKSLVNNVITILTVEQRPLHVNEIVDLLQQRFGRITDRDTISSALAKKARKGVLVRQTGPATFDLREASSHPQADDKGRSE